MPRSPRRRDTITHRIRSINSNLRTGKTIDSRMLSKQMRELDRIITRNLTQAELSRIRGLFRSHLWTRIESTDPRIAKLRSQINNKIMRLITKGSIFPEGAVIKIGGLKFDANRFFLKVEDRVICAKRDAQARRGRINVLVTRLSILERLFGPEVKKAFLEWKRKNPKKPFHEWIRENLK